MDTPRFIGTAAAQDSWAAALLDGHRLRVFLHGPQAPEAAVAQSIASGITTTWPRTPVALELYDLHNPASFSLLLRELAHGAPTPAVWNDDSAPLSTFRLLSALRTLASDQQEKGKAQLEAPSASALAARAAQRGGLFPQPLASVNVNRWHTAPTLDRALLAQGAPVPAKLPQSGSPQATALRAAEQALGTATVASRDPVASALAPFFLLIRAAHERGLSTTPDGDPVELAHACELFALLEPGALAPDLKAVTLTVPDAEGAPRNLLQDARDEPLAPLPGPVDAALARIGMQNGMPIKGARDFSGEHRLWVPLYRADGTEAPAYLEFGRMAVAPTGGRYRSELLAADRAEGRLAAEKLVPWAPRYRVARPFSGWELDFGGPLGLRALMAERLGRFAPGQLERLQGQAEKDPAFAWLLEAVRRSPDVAENRGASAALAAKLLVWSLAQGLETAGCSVEVVASGRILCEGAEATVLDVAARVLGPFGVPFSVRPAEGALSGAQQFLDFSEPQSTLASRALAAIVRERAENGDFSRPATELEALAELQDAAEGLSPRELLAATAQTLTSTEKTPLVLLRDGAEMPMPPGSVHAWPVTASSELSPWSVVAQRAKSRGPVPGIGGSRALIERRAVEDLPDDRAAAIAAALDLAPLAAQVVKQHRTSWT